MIGSTSLGFGDLLNGHMPLPLKTNERWRGTTIVFGFSTFNSVFAFGVSPVLLLSILGRLKSPDDLRASMVN
jgi:hypothetical protein